MKECKLYMVDGQVYIGEVNEEGDLDNAFALSGKLATQLSGRDIGAYLQAENLSELICAGVGENSAVSSRDLKEDELQMINEAEYVMKRAKAKAVLQLENRFFTDNYRGN